VTAAGSARGACQCGIPCGTPTPHLNRQRRPAVGSGAVSVSASYPSNAPPRTRVATDSGSSTAAAGGAAHLHASFRSAFEAPPRSAGAWASNRLGEERGVGRSTTGPSSAAATRPSWSVPRPRSSGLRWAGSRRRRLGVSEVVTRRGAVTCTSGARSGPREAHGWRPEAVGRQQWRVSLLQPLSRVGRRTADSQEHLGATLSMQASGGIWRGATSAGDLTTEAILGIEAPLNARGRAVRAGRA